MKNKLFIMLCMTLTNFISPTSSFAIEKDYSRLIGSSVCQKLPESSWDINTGRVFFGQEAIVKASGDVVVRGFIEDYRNGKFKLLISEINSTVNKSSIPNLVPIGHQSEMGKAQTRKSDGTSQVYQKGYVWDSPSDWLLNCYDPL